MPNYFPTQRSSELRAAKRKRDDHQCKRYRPALDVRIFDRQRIGDGYECADTCTRNKPPDHELRHVRRQRGKGHAGRQQSQAGESHRAPSDTVSQWAQDQATPRHAYDADRERSEEHTSELQSLMRISYAVFCLKKKIKTKQ